MKFLRLFEEFTEEGKVIAKVSDVPIELIIASTDDEKKRGYMYSNGPKEGEGMLFVYPEEQILTFWMKNVKVPLDILFFDSNMRLVNHQSMSPYSDGEEIFYDSKVPAKFALELPSGWIEKYLDIEDSDLIFNI